MSKSTIIRSFSYAFKGLFAAWKERNFKLHVLSASIALILGFFFGISNMEWLIVALCIVGVMAMEIMNTAIEKLVDMIQPEYDERAGKIKDLSAAAVLIFSIGALVCGLIIFVPYMF